MQYCEDIGTFGAIGRGACATVAGVAGLFGSLLLAAEAHNEKDKGDRIMLYAMAAGAGLATVGSAYWLGKPAYHVLDGATGSSLSGVSYGRLPTVDPLFDY